MKIFLFRLTYEKKCVIIIRNVANAGKRSSMRRLRAERAGGWWKLAPRVAEVVLERCRGAFGYSATVAAVIGL